uniref:bax inhibitor 1 isoform X1 n=1 Tax=Myxine glutinosa TaxID=7769 RepID=UPI00358F73C0
MENLLRERNVNIRTLMDLSHIDVSTREHLKNVYACLCISMLSAATGAFLQFHSAFPQIFVHASPFVGLGLFFWLMATPRNGRNDLKRLGILTAFALNIGLGLGPLLSTVIAINPSIVMTAFLGTSAIFLCFTLSALYSRNRTFLYLGGTLSSALCLLCLASLFNLFFQSVILFKIHVYLGLIVMCGFVLYDTQLIVEKCRHGDKDYVWHSVELFLDFVNIFRKIMIILAMNEKQDKKRK